jgi:hypothetical protein
MKGHSRANIIGVYFLLLPACAVHPSFFDYSFKLLRIIFAPVGRRMLNGKPDCAPNGMLVTQEYAINSSTYDNIAFAGILAKGNFQSYQKNYSATYYGMYFAELANTTKRSISEFTRARVNSLITG